VRTGSNAAESAKAGKGGDGLRIREDLPRLIAHGHESLTAAEKDLLKWVGVFFRKPTPGRFMMRIRMPNGFPTAGNCALSRICPAVWETACSILRPASNPTAGLLVGDGARDWEKLRGVDLHSLQTGMDTSAISTAVRSPA